MDFLQTQTFLNLAKSFAGECQAGARYQFLSKQCIQENYNFLSNTLKTLAKNEMAHAKTFFDLITSSCDEVIENIDICAGYPFKMGDLQSHFEYTLEDEKNEVRIYNEYSKVATKEGYPDIAHIFERVASVENCHSMLLQQIVEGFNNNTLYSSKTPIKWKCSNCGNEHTQQKAWEKCDLCSMPKGYVEIPFETGKELKSN